MERNTIIFSFFCKFTERFAMKALGIIVQIVLARYIAPVEFGLLAILTVLEQVADTFMNSGLNIALVQASDLKEDDYSTIFCIRIFGAFFFVFILYLFAPYISVFYGTERLIWPLRVYSLLLILDALNGIKIARLQREMRFREQMFCQIVAVFLSGVVGITLALAGGGLWALVGYGLSQTFFSLIFLCLIDGWLPKLIFRVDRAKKLLNFGIKIFGVGIIIQLYNGCRTLIIGKKFAMTDLAYYDRGKWISDVTAYIYDATMQAVLLSSLSRVQNEPNRVIVMVRKASQLGLFIVVPTLVGMALLAKPLILLLVTEKWVMAIPFMQILSLAYIAVPLNNIWMTAVIALGHSSADLRIECYRKILQIGILIYSVFAYDRVMAIAQWFVIGSFVDILFTIYLTRKYTGYGFHNFLSDCYKPVLATIGMAIVVYAVTINWQLVGLTGSVNLIVEILACSIVGVVVYAGLCYLLKAEAFLYLLGLVKEYLTKRR